MNEDLQRALQTLTAFFTEISPLVFVAASVVLLGLTLCAAHAAWHSYQVLDAIASAPLADLRSTATGWVKLRGTAQALPAKPRQGPSGIVWYKRERWHGSDRSTLVTTDAILTADEHGVCAVDSEQANIRPASHEIDHAFLDKSRSTSEQVIRSGDPVFAIGKLRRSPLSAAAAAHAHCELTRCGGVLLVSGDW